MTDQATIENLTIDEVNYVVGELSDDIQKAVQKYEEWRDRFAVAQDEVQLVGAALRDLGTQIVGAVRAEEQREVEAAAVEEQRAADEAEAEAEVPEAVVSEAAVAEAAVAEAVEADTLVVDDEG